MLDDRQDKMPAATMTATLGIKRMHKVTRITGFGNIFNTEKVCYCRNAVMAPMLVHGDR